MSELKQVFKKAIQTFTHASDFIVSLSEGAVAFFGKAPAALLLIKFSLFEDCLLEICEVASQERNIPFRIEEAERFTAERAKQFIEHELGVVIPNPWPVWAKVRELQSMKDQVVKQGSLDEGSANISDRLLVKINESIVLFFEELRNRLLPNSEAA